MTLDKMAIVRVTEDKLLYKIILDKMTFDKMTGQNDNKNDCRLK